MQKRALRCLEALVCAGALVRRGREVSCKHDIDGDGKCPVNMTDGDGKCPVTMTDGDGKCSVTMT